MLVFVRKQNLDFIAHLAGASLATRKAACFSQQVPRQVGRDLHEHRHHFGGREAGAWAAVEEVLERLLVELHHEAE